MTVAAIARSGLRRAVEPQEMFSASENRVATIKDE